MQSEKLDKGKKRSKAYYRKCAYGGKKQCMSANVLEPGIQGFLVMCNHNEKSAVRESYNILNEYADSLYGIDKVTYDGQESSEEGTDEEEEDVEKAMKKEVEGMKSVASSEKRFQNVLTKAKNCVFIRTTVKSPVDVVTFLMKDIAQRKLQRARYAARILPIIGTCKAATSDIEKLASEVLPSVFLPSGKEAPKSYTIIFKSRNNSGSCCGREGVVSSLIKVVKNINSDVKFTWSDYSLAVLVEIVCTVCCIGVAPDYIRLRKYNLQELTKGVVTGTNATSEEDAQERDSCRSAVLKSEPAINVDVISEGHAQDKDSVSSDVLKSNLVTNVISEGHAQDKDSVSSDVLKSDLVTNVISEGQAQDKDSGNVDILKPLPDTCNDEVESGGGGENNRNLEEEGGTEISKGVTEIDSDTKLLCEKECDLQSDKEKVNDAHSK